MKISVQIDGASDLAKRFARMPSDVELKVQTAALRKGAEPIRDAMAALAPRGDEPPHMADHIGISVPNQAQRDDIGAFDQAVIAVGPTRGFFYASFQEFGTAFHAAQPFARPAFDNTAKKALDLILAHMWKVIGRMDRTAFRQASERAGSSRGRSSGVGL